MMDRNGSTLRSTRAVFAIALLGAGVVTFLLKLHAEPITLGPSSSSSIQKTIVPDANTGTLFKGEKIQSYPGNYKLQDDDSKRMHVKREPFPLLAKMCEKWAVVTTIFEPSEAVKRAAELQDWCMVVVGDTKTPNDYLEQAGLHDRDDIIFLSAQQQKHNENAFVKTMPFQSFARKNIGYLFCIRHGAKVIFDFDDDNVLLHTTSPFLHNLANSNETMVVRHVGEDDMPIAFNPYPLMDPSPKEIWPRGFPLELIKDNRTSGLTSTLFTGSIPVASVGVLQSVCNGDPDVDAIYRLTRPLPVEFSLETTNLLVPPRSYAPYNAQATLHLYKAFWGMLLPMTVPGRVTDIWRAYFTQRIFQDLGLTLVYGPPIVTHTRNSHDYMADMEAEHDLYRKTSTLLTFLEEWNDPSTHLPSRIEKLWIALYERNYIGLDDVEALQQWLLALLDIGYEFPSIQSQESDI